MNEIEAAKKRAAEHALQYVEEEMLLGLGTGSTANYAIRQIAAQVKQVGLHINGVPTSKATESLARGLGITVVSDFKNIDVTIDGADEVDPNGNLIKGGGGALTREKIVAAASKQVIIVVDETKLVRQLGGFHLPIEVLQFGWQSVRQNLLQMAKEVNLRIRKEEVFITDNGNYILDCDFGLIPSPKLLAAEIDALPGVVTHGLFVGLIDKLIVGRSSGVIEEKAF